MLREDERERYGRHLVIPEFGAEGQERLKAASVLVVGVGGLGSPVALYLAAAGVGRLGLVDGDWVELSNLQRQTLHSTADIGSPKTQSAAEKLQALNPDVRLELHQERFTADNAGGLVRAYDVVVTAVDNFATRYLLNDVCVAERKVLVEGAVLRFNGMAMTIKGGETACYRCVFPEPPSDAAPTTVEAGVFGPAAGVIGAVQAAEVMKVLVGFGEPLYNRLLQVDVADMSFHEVAVARVPECPACGMRSGVSGLGAGAGASPSSEAM